MSRSDQYIGLTQRAQEFVSTLELMPSYSIDGAWNRVELGVWTSKEPGPNGKCVIYIERVQMCPWSSGPMYFTYLVADYQNGGEISCFQWSNEPWIDNSVEESWRTNPEYDSKIGVCYL